MRSSVDLPQPDGPTSTQNSPSAMAMSTPRMTWVVPNHFWTAVMVTPRPSDSSSPLFLSVRPRGRGGGRAIVAG